MPGSALIRAHPDLAGKAAIAGDLTPESTREQAAAGLDRLTPEQHARIIALTAEYRERFGFPFIVCAREHTADSIIAAAAERVRGRPRRRGERRLVRDRQDRPPAARRPGRMSGARISYGKLEVPVQCVGVAPLRGLPEIPESPVRALDTGLLACEVSMEVLGQGFLAAYTEGDNRDVVATDTMKNVILRHALEHDGATLEGFLDALGRRFLGTYPEMEGLRLTARELPFAPVRVGAGEERSDRLFSLGGGDRAVAELELARDADSDDRARLRRSGQVGLRLLKTTGSAFTRFARDDATTLPERADRPLFIAPRRALALRRPGRRARRRPRALRRGRAGARRRLRGLPRVRLGVDPAPRARDGPAAAGPLPDARRRSRSRARTTRTIRCRAPTPARTAAPTRPRSPPGG